MRLVSFSLSNGPARPGLVLGDEVVDLSDPAVGLPPDMAQLLALGPAALDRARAAGLPVAGGAVQICGVVVRPVSL